MAPNPHRPTRPALRSAAWVLLPLIGALFLAPPVSAQEDEEAEEAGWGGVFIQAEAWIAEAEGLQYIPALEVVSNQPLVGTSREIPQQKELAGRWTAAYYFPKGGGEIRGVYYSHLQEAELAAESPGNFIFRENLPPPQFAGFNLDGLSDSFASNSSTRLRDYRIDYGRTAFQTRRAQGKWFVGYRHVYHRRTFNVLYPVIISGLPPFLPPLVPTPPPGIDPLPDRVSMESKFRARGIEAGLDVVFPVYKDRVIIETGFVFAVLRGKVDSIYQANTHFYEINFPMSPPVVATPPYDDFDDLIATGATITQQTTFMQLNTNSQKQNANVLEAYAGIRGRVWKQLEVNAGFRAASYDAVGLDYTGASVFLSDGSAIVEDLDQIERSAIYEGYYLGVSYTF